MNDISNFEYLAPWQVHALAWSTSPSTNASSSKWQETIRGNPYQQQQDNNQKSSGSSSNSNPSGIPRDARIAIGSFVDEYTNRIQILGVTNDEYGLPTLAPVADSAHPYPATRIAFQPSTLDEGGSGGNDGRSSYYKQSKSGGGSWGSGDVEDGTGGYDAISRYPDREVLATTADCLRIWECLREEDGGGSGSGFVGDRSGKGYPFALREKSVLAHSKNTTTSPAPLTSFSWNVPSPNLIVTSSIDTTCTIWDLPSRTALTQLIAHDREVYDVDWCPGSSDVFASVGADGSVRVFDLRSLEHSTIIYETGNPGPMSTGSGGNNGDTSRPSSGMSHENLAAPLLRIAFNPWDANYLATFHLDSDSVQILDVRAPGSPILELRGHQGAINAVAWGPPGTGFSGGSSKGMICTAGDDSQCLVYDLASATLRSASAQGRRSRNGAGPSPAPSSDRGGINSSIGAEVPILAYSAEEMVNNVAWLRLPTLGGSSTNKSGGGVVQEWDEYGNKSASGPDIDWLAMTSGRSVRVLRV